MAVDLAKLPDDEERVRQYAMYIAVAAREIKNVLDALNYYRCKAKFAEQELARAESELEEIGRRL